jgi:hypothetical protein
VGVNNLTITSSAQNALPVTVSAAGVTSMSPATNVIA